MLTCAFALIALTWLVMLVAVAGAGRIVLYAGLMAGWPLAIAMLLCVAAAWWSARSTPRARAVLLGGIATFFVFVAFAMRTLWATREWAVSGVTGSNLRGIGQSLRLYREEYRAWPSDLFALVDTKVASGGLLHAALDAAAPVYGAAEGYSSFEYRPPAPDTLVPSETVIAWEREPWTPLELRLWPRYGRTALLADGTVEVLAETDFAAGPGR